MHNTDIYDCPRDIREEQSSGDRFRYKREPNRAMQAVAYYHRNWDRELVV